MHLSLEAVGVGILSALTAFLACFLVAAGIRFSVGKDFWLAPFCFLGALLLSVRLSRKPVR